MKKLIFLISVFVLIFSLFCSSAFAITSLPIVNSSNITSNGLLAGKYQGQNVYLGLTQNPYNVPYYLFYYQAGTNTNFVLCVKYTEAPDVSNVNQIEFVHQVGSGSFITSYPNKTNSLLGVTPPSGIYYTNWNTTANLTNFNSSIDTFTNLSEGFSAANSYLTAVNPNNPPSYQGANTTVTVSAGNVAYIGVASDDVNMMIYGLPKFRNSYTSNIRISSSDTIPSLQSSLVYDNSFGVPIVFSAVQPLDILGRSTTGSYKITVDSPHYVVIYNPLTDNDGNTNPTVRVHVKNMFAVIQYPLTANIVNGAIQSVGSPDEFYIAMDSDVDSQGSFDYIYYNVDSEGETVTNSAITVPAGGNNTIIDSDPDTSLGGFLQRILSIFTAPIQYIQQLFDSGSVFMSWLSNVWTWLPSPVVGVLTSALIVLIVVGVIKFLWK